ncbi:helix-turn-helix domain-containing protein [Candidatus Pacearchaeota archaeon]|nr:helix-turn-helix domain-containing protein [Candidatus Pacearchaeota archaeon]
MDENILREIGLTENESKVYLALLKLKKGTKTSIVREAKVLSSKVYEILDRLIQKGLVAYFIENGVKNFVPVPPNSIELIFEEKMKNLEKRKLVLRDYVEKHLAKSADFSTDAQLFKGWNGLQQVLMIICDDLKSKETYYVLGLNATEDIEQGFLYIPKVAKKFDEKKIIRKIILNPSGKETMLKYLKEYGNKKLWNARYFPSIGPLEIGMSNNYVVLNLLEKEPIAILIKNKRIRDSFLHYFNTIWKLGKKLNLR